MSQKKNVIVVRWLIVLKSEGHCHRQLLNWSTLNETSPCRRRHRRFLHHGAHPEPSVGDLLWAGGAPISQLVQRSSSSCGGPATMIGGDLPALHTADFLGERWYCEKKIQSAKVKVAAKSGKNTVWLWPSPVLAVRQHPTGSVPSTSTSFYNKDQIGLGER